MQPVIQLFYGTGAQKEIEEKTLQYFLDLRGEKKEITLEPILHPIVSNLAKDCGTEISVKQVWASIQGKITGHFDERRPNEYHTLEYGTIYNNSISNILEHTFGGRPKHKKDGNWFIFDREELERVGRSYTSTGKIKTILSSKIGEGYEGNEGSTGEPPSSNEFHETDSREESDDRSSKNNKREGGVDPQEPSQPSQPSPCYYCHKPIIASEFVAHLDKCAKERDESDEPDVQGKGEGVSEGPEHEGTDNKSPYTHSEEATHATQEDSFSKKVEEEPDLESLQEELQERDK